MSNAQNGVLFQINDTGSTLMVGWPLAPSDAWLFLDRDGDGLVNHGGELFGNTTRLDSGRPAANGYEALAELDANEDHVLDAQDPMFGSLRLWHDVDRDGVSVPSEIRTLAADGVVALSLEAAEKKLTDSWGNRFRLRAVVTMVSSPRHRFSYDVFPVTSPPDGGSPACPQRRASDAVREIAKQ